MQLQWHANCSIFLLNKDCAPQSVLPDLNKELCDVQRLWQEFCDLYPHSEEKCKNNNYNDTVFLSYAQDFFRTSTAFMCDIIRF